MKFLRNKNRSPKRGSNPPPDENNSQRKSTSTAATASSTSTAVEVVSSDQPISPLMDPDASSVAFAPPPAAAAASNQNSSDMRKSITKTPSYSNQQQQQQQQQVPGPPRLQSRRSTLHRMTSSLASYRATPITKHYALNNQILAAFESHYANNLFTVAYAIGLQFVETALLEIPKHGYFYSSRHATERMTNSLDAIRVSNMLRTILEEQQHKGLARDFAGIHDLSKELEKIQKLNHLAVEQASEASFEHYEKQRAQVEAEINEQKRREDCTTLLTETCGPFLETFTDMCPSTSGYSNTTTTMMNSMTLPFTTPSSQSDDHGELISRNNSHHEPPPQPTTTNIQQYDPLADPPPPTTQTMKERSVSTMMRHIMEHGSSKDGVSNPNRPDPPEQHFGQNSIQSIKTYDSMGIPPPPQLSDEGWTVLPEQIPERPEFARGQSYADHVALERALYLSGLEVQSQGPPPPGTTYQQQPPAPQQQQDYAFNDDDDDNWMLQHALKESEREMQKLKEEEEQQIMELYQKSAQEQQQEQLLYNTNDDFPSPHLQRRKTKTQLETQTLHTLYHEDFVSLWNNGRIRITHVDTYQGKLPGSVNGCTVIAPLLCIHHFINERQNDPGLPDETILSVIDEEVPSILPKVREEIGVLPDAFLIPSDSHDYLIKNQLLSQQQFVTVIGGNILDDRHVQELVGTLQNGGVPPKPKSSTSIGDNDAELQGRRESTNDSSSKTNHVKIACTLFFHEHVIAILKLQRAHDGKAWYDIIDSLPSKEMLSREIGSALSADSGEESSSAVDTSPANAVVAGGNPITDPFGFSLMTELEDCTPMNTARIRCLDEEALTAALRWYACSKFNGDNLVYIDNYPWDDLSTDFDPRVFQAFVWSEAA